jgi:hypothetical protein
MSTTVGSRFLEQYVHRQIVPHPLDQVLTLSKREYHQRPDLFAIDYYGHEDLFWIVPVRSGMQDLVFDFVVGATIIVPAPSYISSII